MLNLDDPMTEHIFAAGRAKDAVLIAAKHMTVAARHERVRLRDGCGPAFADMRQLARDHFADFPAIPPAINDLERSVAELTMLPGVPEQGPPAEYNCPACGAALERRGRYGFLAPDNPTDIYCSPCLDIVLPSLTALQDGFGTYLI